MKKFRFDYKNYNQTKKVFLTFVVILLVNIATAQDPFKTDVMKVIEMSGAAGPMQMAKEQIVQIIPEAKKVEFSKDFETSLPVLYDKLATVYMETYSPADIKAMLAFYQSPVGKKISASSGELVKKTKTPFQEWETDLQTKIIKYMQ